MSKRLYLSANYFDDLMVRMAHHSTAIEGNTLTQGETKSILIDGYIPRAMNMRELNEVLNYKAYTKQMIDDLSRQRIIDLDFIRAVHATLCHNAIEGVPGQFKTVPNMVIGADFTPTPPYMVPSALENWRLDLSYQIQHAATADDITAAAIRQHIAFEKIHPFSDGNGRVGRALLVYVCLSCHILPVVVPVQEKPRYINYLNTGDVPGFLSFAKELQQAELIRIEALAAHDGDNNLFVDVDQPPQD